MAIFALFRADNARTLSGLSALQGNKPAQDFAISFYKM
jgi:hypothetical protein